MLDFLRHQLSRVVWRFTMKLVEAGHHRAATVVSYLDAEVRF